MFFFFSSRRRHTRYWRDWSSDVCSSDLGDSVGQLEPEPVEEETFGRGDVGGPDDEVAELAWSHRGHAPHTGGAAVGPLESARAVVGGGRRARLHDPGPTRSEE